MSNKTSEASPFAESVSVRPTISLGMLIFSVIVFAAFSLVIMFAARVPVISNAINDFFGLAHTATPDKPDRSTHLFFLLFCYASPLLLATVIGLLHVLLSRVVEMSPSSNSDSEPDSPFA